MAVRAGHEVVDPCAVVDNLADLLLIVDLEGTLRFANPVADRLLGVDRQEWIGQNVFSFVHPDDLPSLISSIDAMRSKERGTPIELRIRDAAGGWRWFETVGSSVTLADGSVGLLNVLRDVTQRRMWEVAADDVTKFQQVLHHAPSITLLLDGQGTITSTSAAFTRLLGWDATVAIGRPLASFVAPGSRAEVASAFARLAMGERSVTFEVRMSLANDPSTTRPLRFELTTLLDDPIVAGIVASAHDVSELDHVRHELEYLAHHDALTGLANRSYLVEVLQTRLDLGDRFAVLFVDLDRFKPVNDLWGHETGDAVLRIVGRRLHQCVRPGDLVARVGGDEFVVLAHGFRTGAEARAFADRIEAVLSAPYHLEVGPIRVGASIGIAVPDRDSTVESVLADADLGMYDAKSERRGGSVRSNTERRRSAVERRRLADDFIAGLERGEVTAHLQPIVDVAQDCVVGVEALARWNHPTLGLLYPGSFIDLVEDAGLDLALGDVVLDSAAAAMRRLADHGLHPELGINLSVGQLADADLPDRIGRVLATHDVPWSQLVVEITEQAILARRSAVGAVTADETLHALHRCGARLSLDDFGTGYSSLTHVRRFPLSAVKIDRSFVEGMFANAQDRAVIEVVLGLGRALDLLVVAEGVAQPAQLDGLRALGCTHIQGHLIAAAMPCDEAVPWMLARARSRRDAAA